MNRDVDEGIGQGDLMPAVGDDLRPKELTTWSGEVERWLSGWTVAARGVRDDGRAGGCGSSGMRAVAAQGGERVLRWIVSVYVLAVVGGILIALVGLSEGWW